MNNPHSSLSYKWFMPFVLFVLLLSRQAYAQTITTLAGGVGNDTTAQYARITYPNMVTTDHAGNVYIRENIIATNSYRKLNVLSNTVTAIQVGGRGVFDTAGNWYYAFGNYVKKVTPMGTVTTLAGNGTTTYSGDGGVALLAGMSVDDVAIDAAGNIYVTDVINRRVRKINTAGIITTIAGTGASGYTGDAGNATAATFITLKGITADAAGNVYVADRLANVIRKITTTGIISTVAGAGIARNDSATGSAVYLSSPQSPRVSSTGDVYYTQYDCVYKLNPAGIVTRVAGEQGISGFSGDGGPATSARLNDPRDITIDGSGNLYIADFQNNRVRKVDASGVITTVVGNGLPFYGNGADEPDPLLSRFWQVSAAIYDHAGNLYIADKTNSKISRISTSGVMTTYAGNGITGYNGDGAAATAASLGNPVSMVFDAAGNLYIAESINNRVRRVSPTGIISTVAGGGTAAPGDGGLATDAQISASDIAIDAHNNLLIVDGANRRIRKVDATTGIITTVAGNGTNSTTGDGGAATAAGLANPTGIAIDVIGNMYVSGNLVRKIDTAGIITTIPFSTNYIAVDTMGNLYTATNNVVRRYDIYNYTSVIAGNGTAGFSGDGGPATTAQLTVSGKISIDSFGRVLIPAGNGVRRLCCLSNDIDRPPLFVRGASTNITVCVSSTANSLDTLLRVIDQDAGDVLTWSVIVPPNNGTLSGFPYSATATGDTVVPAGLTYTPPAGYLGSTNFRIKVSDGEDTAMIIVNVSVSNPPSLGSLSGSQSVCVGSTGVQFTASRPSGLWSVTNGSAAVDASGRVTGVTAGVDTIVYTYPTYCGPVTITRAVTVNVLPVVTFTSAPDYVCKDASVTCSAIPAGGYWSTTSSLISVNSNGKVEGYSAGTAIITYTYNAACGSVYDTTHISIYLKPVVAVTTGNNNQCIGQSVTLRNTSLGGVWSSSNTAVATVSPFSLGLIDTVGRVYAVATGTTIISYTVTNVCGTATDTMLFTVRNTPNVGVITGNNGVCVGSSIALSNHVSGTWSISDSLIASISPDGNVSVHNSGNVSISYTVNNACGVGSVVVPLYILTTPQLTPISGKSVVITGSSVQLRGRAPSGTWSCNNENVLTIDAWGVATGHRAGQAVVTYQEQDPNSGCIASESLLMTVTSVANSRYNHFPNPASRFVNVTFKGSSTPEARLFIADQMGRIVYEGVLTMISSEGQVQLNISSLSNGVYSLIIRAPDGEYRSRLVVLHQ